jgi:hypothetical protein
LIQWLFNRACDPPAGAGLVLLTPGGASRWAVTQLLAAGDRSHPFVRAMGSAQRNQAAPDLAQAIGIKGMGQEDADADEGEEGCYDLDHSFPPRVEMPGSARLRNSR